MAQQNKGKKKGNKPRVKVIRINLAWLYIPFILLIVGMLYSNKGVPAQKIEWAQVQEIVRSGDVKEIHFVRNDFEGTVTIRPDSLGKYAEMFGGQVPSKSPHFSHRITIRSIKKEDKISDINSVKRFPSNDD